MFTIDGDGWLQPAVHCPSGNYNARPPATAIDLLVIHNISLPPGEFGGDYIRALFTNSLDCSAHPALEDLRDIEVSAHLLIDRRGQVTQFVSFLQRAWHAGVSHFDGRDNCNDFSIGIELEGTDCDAYTDGQYRQLALVTQILMQNFPGIVPARIVGHSEIAPLRKTDPGPAFDWSRYRHMLREVNFD